MRTRLSRTNTRTKRRLFHNNKTTLLGSMTLVAVLSGILLFYTGIINKQNIYASYCFESGFFGGQLVLYKNGYYIDTSSGCLGSIRINGQWVKSDNTLVLFPKDIEYTTIEMYKIINNTLISCETKEIQYIFCEDVEEQEELIFVCGGA